MSFWINVFGDTLKRLTVPVAALVVTALFEPAMADSPKRPEPDAGLLAALDSQPQQIEEGTAIGDFEYWYPDLYPDFSWMRVITEIGSNGLFQVDYTISDSRRKEVGSPQQMSILLF